VRTSTILSRVAAGLAPSQPVATGGQSARDAESIRRTTYDPTRVWLLQMGRGASLRDCTKVSVGALAVDEGTGHLLSVASRSLHDKADGRDAARRHGIRRRLVGGEKHQSSSPRRSMVRHRVPKGSASDTPPDQAPVGKIRKRMRF